MCGHKITLLQNQTAFWKWIEQNDSKWQVVLNIIIELLNEARKIKRLFIHKDFFPFEGIFIGIHFVPTKKRMICRNGEQHVWIAELD